MYAFIEGQVAEKQANELVLSVQGVGYQILCTQASLAIVSMFASILGLASVKTRLSCLAFHPGKSGPCFCTSTLFQASGPAQRSISSTACR